MSEAFLMALKQIARMGCGNSARTLIHHPHGSRAFHGSQLISESAMTFVASSASKEAATECSLFDLSSYFGVGVIFAALLYTLSDV
ncbi:hypothetical protein M5K25_002303 [Dendrobium thyrsiflorum]|uniref:Uncharacterized protein n=1 Tax=Dendrobium thyrsiflorum TaxID=117978 RepID=A0ABD0VSA2_DENTH